MLEKLSLFPESSGNSSSWTKSITSRGMTGGLYLLYLQKLEGENRKNSDLRLGYYTIGAKPGGLKANGFGSL
jgi:hypothetical protein